MKICLVRHGETDWNLAGKFQGREDIPLNETGIQQIQQAVAYFKKSHWDEIISSPLARAKQSAQIIRREVGLPQVHEDADLMERDLGKISGMTQQEMEKSFPNGSYEGMEPQEKLRSRASGALLKWIEKFDKKDIIVLTHGAVINAILTDLSGGTIAMGKAIPKNAQITLLEKQEDSINIVFYNKNWSEL